jgi:hypothetical protein
MAKQEKDAFQKTFTPTGTDILTYFTIGLGGFA